MAPGGTLVLRSSTVADSGAGVDLTGGGAVAIR